jgi:hypothetical protein
VPTLLGTLLNRSRCLTAKNFCCRTASGNAFASRDRSGEIPSEKASKRKYDQRAKGDRANKARRRRNS